jgi:hypothetical protein
MEEEQWQKTEQQTERNSRQNQITEIDMETGEIIYDTEKEISPGFSEQRNSNGTGNKKNAAEIPADRYTGTHTPEPDAGCGGQSCLGLLGGTEPAESETEGTGTEAASLILPPDKEGMRSQ